MKLLWYLYLYLCTLLAFICCPLKNWPAAEEFSATATQTSEYVSLNLTFSSCQDLLSGYFIQFRQNKKKHPVFFVHIPVNISPRGQSVLISFPFSLLMQFFIIFPSRVSMDESFDITVHLPSILGIFLLFHQLRSTATWGRKTSRRVTAGGTRSSTSRGLTDCSASWQARPRGHESPVHRCVQSGSPTHFQVRQGPCLIKTWQILLLSLKDHSKEL